MIIEGILIGSIIANGIGIIVIRERNKQIDKVIKQSLVIEQRDEKRKLPVHGKITVEINGEKVVDIENSDDL